MSSKIMLVTGASGGIGYAIAQYYHENDYAVIGCGRSDMSCQFDYVQCDVSDYDSIISMFNYIRAKYGKLNVLINNAGIASMNHCLTIPYQTIKSVFSVNTFGTFIVSQEAAKLMKDGGCIVNVSSIASPMNMEGESIYAASKSAIESLTKTMAKELAPLEITVNAVGPCPVLTDLLKGVQHYKMEELFNILPFKQYAEVDDVINVINFFISPSSYLITGQIIYINAVV